MIRALIRGAACAALCLVIAWLAETVVRLGIVAAPIAWTEAGVAETWAFLLIVLRGRF